jgi:phage tail-like protein
MTDTGLPAATQSYGPYRSFKFIVSWGGRPVAGVSKVGGLTRATEVASHGEGGTPRSPGQTDYGPITLERGVTHDPEFEAWANKVWAYGNAAGQEVALRDYRKDITITQLDEAGEPVASYAVLCCWVSEYTALPELDASGTAVAIQSITLQHEGWQRDPGVAEPTEPSV